MVFNLCTSLLKGLAMLWKSPLWNVMGFIREVLFQTEQNNQPYLLPLKIAPSHVVELTFLLFIDLFGQVVLFSVTATAV